MSSIFAFTLLKEKGLRYLNKIWNGRLLMHDWGNVGSINSTFLSRRDVHLTGLMMLNTKF